MGGGRKKESIGTCDPKKKIEKKGSRGTKAWN